MVFRSGASVAFALTTGLHLYYEGQWMRNCVAQYQKDCLSGNILIYHAARLKNPRAFVPSEFSFAGALFKFLKNREMWTDHITIEVMRTCQAKDRSWKVGQIERKAAGAAQTGDLRFTLEMEAAINKASSEKKKNARLL